ncbi:Transcriptional regulator ADR1 [Coniochaeta hoffmannii]|uniref:Transcriptional regulator ADR1 n=1 Tax=Coniochaeta hoffmannii TaxID=91930 RepID=A0AA38S7W6_9PEZI|nr:Transcriptional regulator ADR1 [Coniochaeta hoffmannii]
MPAGTTTTEKTIWCTHCGKSFTRKEHLERHIPTHTNVKPWNCHICYMEFTRKDLLSRHMSTYHVPKVPGEPSTDFNSFAPSLEIGLQPNVPTALRRHTSSGTMGFPLGTPDSSQLLGLGDIGPNYQDISQGYPSFLPAEELFDFMGLDAQKPASMNPYDASEGSPSLGFLSTPSPVTPNTRGTSISGDFDMQQMHKPMEHESLELRFDAAASQSPILEFEDVVKAEESWPLARCTRPFSKAHNTWEPLETYVREHVNWKDEDLTAVVPLKGYTRDSMLAITQKFLQKALEIHGSSGAKDGYSGFVVLPPSDIIHYFLRSYVRTLSVYYPLLVSGCVDPNDMLADCRPSTLLLLLMIAQGAAAMPVAEARYLSTGLTETCRISLFDIIEKNVELSADPVALRCALLFTLLGSWSGDKWLMDIAMGQRGMYMSMLKHAGMLESQTLPILDLSGDNIKAQKEAWIDRESRNRLVYNWVMLDHELSLFHDSAPLLAITDLQCALPAPEELWTSVDSADWAATMQTMYGGLSPHMNPRMLGNHLQTPSLCDLFQNFLQDNLSERYTALTAQQLRLLLHPIQAMLCHLRQLHSCLPEPLVNCQPGMPTVSRDSMQQRIHEVQNLLQQWYNLTMTSTAKDPQCLLTRCNLVLYHLMYLNTVTNFPEIERLARREGLDDKSSFPHLEVSLRRKRCILQREETILHCGQVLGLLRQMPRNRRPSWWTAAMYRAVLSLWADSVTLLDNSSESANAGGLSSYHQHNMVPVDAARQDDPALNACIWQHNGIPVLSHLDGRAVGLDKPSEILDYGIRAVGEADSSRIGDGIRRKLATLMSNWDQAKPWDMMDSSLNDGVAESWGNIDQAAQNL